MVLINHMNCGQTIVQNAFIDRYMTAANGEYVKVYLLILRLAGTGELSVSYIADRLDVTEKDVMRALRYWEKTGLMTLALNGDGTLERLTLSSVVEAGSVVVEEKEAVPEPVSKYVSQEAPAAAAKEDTADEKPAPETGKVLQEKRLRTLDKLADDEDFAGVLFIAENYLGRALKSKDIELLIRMYDEYNFPVDVIEYLIEYCVNDGNKRTEYLNSVALGWHEEGIHTLEEAKEQVRARRANSGINHAVLKAFGIYGRAAVEHEQKFISRWTGELGMTIEVILEACAESMRQNVKKPFDYTNRILEKWHAEGIKSPDDVRRYRQEHHSAQKSSSAAATEAREKKEAEQRRESEDRDTLARRRQELISRHPEYEELETKLADIAGMRCLALVAGDENNADELLGQLTELRTQKAGLLKAEGLPEDYLEKI